MSEKYICSKLDAWSNAKERLKNVEYEEEEESFLFEISRSLMDYKSEILSDYFY